MKKTAIVLCLAMVAGCTEPESEPSPVVTDQKMVSDSAGVELVVNSEPRYPQGPYRFERRPAIRIGSIDNPETSFGRPTDATRLSDGRILVLDSQIQTIYEYSPTGRRRGQWGRSGQGPGEFARAYLMQRLPGDTVAVLDRRAFRMTLIGPDGQMVRTIQQRFDFEPGGMMAAQSCCVPMAVVNSSTAIWRYPMQWSRDGSGDRPVIATVLRVDGEGTDTLGVFAAGVAAPWSGGVNRVVRKKFSPRLEGGTGNGRLFVGGGDFVGYDELDPATGELVRRVRADVPRLPVTQEILDRWRAEVEGTRSPESTSRSVEQRLRAPVADSLPAYENLLVSAAGHVWLQEPYTLEEDQEVAYAVFDPEGTWLGRVVLPGRLWLLEVGSDYILGARMGEYDEAYIELWTLLPG